MTTSRLTIFLLASLLACSTLAGGQEQEAAGPDAPAALTVMTYNIRHGQGADGRVDLERVAEVIRAQAPDLVALQEVDRYTRRVGVDQVERLAALTGMEAAFGFALRYQGGDFGNAVLSRLPIEASDTIPLPGVEGRDEPRSALAVDVRVPREGDPDAPGLPLTFLSTHMDLQEASRLASAERLNRLPEARPDRAFVLAGDLNAGPDSPTLRALTRTWTNPTAGKLLPTIPVDAPDRQLDYVLLWPEPRWEVVEVRVVPEREASDHRPVVAVLRLRAGTE